jgi:hypothetical protein
MKKLCFVEMEGVLLPLHSYSPDEKKSASFVSSLSKYAKKNKIELYLISGYHERVAKEKFALGKLSKYFDEKHFIFVNEHYISKKSEDDAKLHKKNLEDNPNFVDSFFKQVVLSEIIAEKNILPSDVLLLCNDAWVDAYYTTRFSKVDFALLQDNVCDRGKKIDPISGLAYFSLSIGSVKFLLSSFPVVDFSALDKYVYDEMKRVLVGSSFKDAVVKGLSKRSQLN